MRRGRRGRYRQIVTVQALAATGNSFGEPVETWAAATGVGATGSPGVVHARITPLQGRERWAAQQVAAEVTHEVEMRYFPGLGHGTHRLLHGSRVLNIEAVMNEDEENRTYFLACTEESE